MFNEGQRNDYSCTVTGNDVNFTYTGGETTYSGKGSGAMNCDNLNGIANYYWNQKKETFFEHTVFANLSFRAYGIDNIKNFFQNSF